MPSPHYNRVNKRFGASRSHIDRKKVNWQLAACDIYRVNIANVVCKCRQLIYHCSHFDTMHTSKSYRDANANTNSNANANADTDENKWKWKCLFTAYGLSDGLTVALSTDWTVGQIEKRRWWLGYVKLNEPIMFVEGESEREWCRVEPARSAKIC